MNPLPAPPPQVTKGSDVYSFGVILWSFYTGQLPWVLQGGALLPNKHFPRYRHRTCSSAGNDPAHTEYRRLVEHCLRADPHERPTFDEIAACLSGILSSFCQAPPCSASTCGGLRPRVPERVPERVLCAPCPGPPALRPPVAGATDAAVPAFPRGATALPHGATAPAHGATAPIHCATAIAQCTAAPAAGPSHSATAPACKATTALALSSKPVDEAAKQLQPPRNILVSHLLLSQEVRADPAAAAIAPPATAAAPPASRQHDLPPPLPTPTLINLRMNLTVKSTCCVSERCGPTTLNPEP